MAVARAEVKRKVGPISSIKTGFGEFRRGCISVPPPKKITKVIFSMLIIL